MEAGRETKRGKTDQKLFGDNDLAAASQQPAKQGSRRSRSSRARFVNPVTRISARPGPLSPLFGPVTFFGHRSCPTATSSRCSW